MNDLIKSGGNGVAMTPAQRRAEVLAKVQKLRDEGHAPQPAARGNKVYASFNGNSGLLTYGRAKSEFEADQEFVVPLEGVLRGCLLWSGGTVKNRRLSALLDGPAPMVPEGEPRAGDLPKPRERDGWVDVIVLDMSGKGGEVDGIVVELTCSSYGAYQMATDLTAAMVAMAQTEKGAEGFFNPIIKFEVDSYMHKQYQREVFNPIAKIIGWTDGETIIPAEQGLLDDKAEDDVLG